MTVTLNSKRVRRLTATLFATALFTAAAAAAQTPPASAPKVVGVNVLHLNVTNLQKSLAFYRDVLGMEPTAPIAPPRAGGALVTEPGAMLQTVILKVPGGSFSMEIIEWTGTPLRAQQPRNTLSLHDALPIGRASCRERV